MIQTCTHSRIELAFTEEIKIPSIPLDNHHPRPSPLTQGGGFSASSITPQSLCHLWPTRMLKVSFTAAVSSPQTGGRGGKLDA